MAKTYSQIYIHVVFAVEGWHNLINLEHHGNYKNTSPELSPDKVKNCWR